VALARHFEAESQAPAWNAEMIRIEASLPKLKEHGRLQAIRRLLGVGRPEYEVLASEGGRTVRQQVIARYLTADAQGGGFAPSSVAITPANYRFRYQGSISDGTTLTYIYEIAPRRKEGGLIRGQLWIDAATGLTVRQSGDLVRSPSIFVKRVHIRRDTTLRDGAAWAKVTRLEIDTRIAGQAELTITETPFSEGLGETGGTR